MPGHNRDHYSGDYQRRARLVRTLAYGDPTTRCWRTGLTLEQGRERWGDKVTWQAGHIIDGDPHSALAAELSYPNQAAGARLGNRRRQGLVTTRVW